MWLSFIESKTHQDKQEQYIPEAYADIVREAVSVTQHITESLAKESGLDFLFLTSTKGGSGGGAIRPPSVEGFTSWLNGSSSEDGQVLRRGFIHRHNICYQGYYYAINPHQTRHTIATQIYLGGGGFGTVTEHLHHRSPVMTGV